MTRFPAILSSCLLLVAVACSPNTGGPLRSYDAPILHCDGIDGGEPLAPQTGPTAIDPPQTTVVLAGSGDMAPGMPLPAFAAQDPSESGLTPPLHVSTPNASCPRLQRVFSPDVAIPLSGTVRQLEATFDGTPLRVIDRGRSELTEDVHTFGEDVPFDHPLFSTEGVAPGVGTLVVNGYDASHTLVSTQTIPNIEVLPPARAVNVCDFAATPHPRIWITPARLAAARARDRATDVAAVRFWGNDGVGYFLAHDTAGTDVTSCGFENMVYDPQSYIPALALCYQLDKGVDDATATQCATAAHTLAMDLVHKYETNATPCDGAAGHYKFGHDTGYNIRFDLMYVLIAYDWLNDLMSVDDRTRIVALADAWVAWYHATPGYSETLPWENYYAGWVQGLLLTIVATAGENAAVDGQIELLNGKLAWEMPLLDQRLCGGDWPEGWNYGADSVQELALVRSTLRDYGDDWSGDFDWLESMPAFSTYQMLPDFSRLLPWGGYSGSTPSKTSAALLAILSSTTTQGALAARLYTQAIAAPVNDLYPVKGRTAYEMIFADTSADGSTLLAALPRSTLASGTGRWISRSAMNDPAAYTVTAENVSWMHDHFGYANGDVRLYAGSTCLVCPSAYTLDAGGSFDGEGTTPDFSTYLVNGLEQTSNGHNDQILFQLEHDGWSAVGLRFESAYVKDRFDETLLDPMQPLDYMIREIVHVRPGTLVVRDLHRRRHAGDTLTGRWHLGPTGSATSETNGFAIGGLHVGFFVSGASVTPQFASDTPPGTSGGVGTLMTESFPGSTNAVEVVHVFSQTDTAVSYTGGVLKLSGGSCVHFAGGTVDVTACP